MKHTYLITLFVGLLTSQRAAAAVLKDPSDPQPFNIDLCDRVPRLLELVSQTRLPANQEYPGVGATLGFDLEILKDLQEEWITTFDWKTQEASLNKYD
jgi:hypothetical protein